MAVNAYNSAIGSIESQVLVRARRFEEYGAIVGSDHIEELRQIESSSRLLQSPELLGTSDGQS